MRETGKYWTRKKASQLQIEITLKGSTEKKKNENIVIQTLALESDIKF